MNTEYTIYEFRTCAQKQGETLGMNVTELKKLAKFCNFQNLDHQLKSQIIQNCRSTELRTQILEKHDWTLKQVLDKGRAMELSKTPGRHHRMRRNIGELSPNEVHEQAKAATVEGQGNTEGTTPTMRPM